MLIRYSIDEIHAMLDKCRELGYEPKMEISFISRYDYYVLRYGEEITFQRSGKEEDRSIVMRYDNFEDMANDGRLDELLLEAEWGDIDYLYCEEFDKCDLWNDISRDMYFEGEDFGDMPVKNKRFKGVDTLEQLFVMLTKCYRAETAHPVMRDKWRETDATYGQSQIAAMLVQDMFGGNIRLTHIDGEKHYFNEVDGKTIDLTSDHYEEQFIMINFADSTEVDRAGCDADADVLARYELLQKRVDDYIDMVTR